MINEAIIIHHNEELKMAVVLKRSEVHPIFSPDGFR